MRKTSVYLTEAEARLLAEVASEEGSSQASVLREALAEYAAGRRRPVKRDFAIIGCFEGKGGGTSVVDIPEEELLRGFGDDAWSDEPSVTS
jgi:hypothetical protein